MLTKITSALALALAAAFTVPASAAPQEPYSSGYQDQAYGKNGW
jgi:hypothetical protein